MLDMEKFGDFTVNEIYFGIDTLIGKKVHLKVNEVEIKKTLKN